MKDDTAKLVHSELYDPIWFEFVVNSTVKARVPLMKSVAFNSTLQSSSPTPYSIFFCVMVLFALKRPRECETWLLAAQKVRQTNEAFLSQKVGFSEKCPAFEKRSHPSTLMMTRTSYLWCKKAEGIMLPSQTRGGTVCWNEFFVDFLGKRNCKVKFPVFFLVLVYPSQPNSNKSLTEVSINAKTYYLTFTVAFCFPRNVCVKPISTHSAVAANAAAATVMIITLWLCQKGPCRNTIAWCRKVKGAMKQPLCPPSAAASPHMYAAPQPPPLQSHHASTATISIREITLITAKSSRLNNFLETWIICQIWICETRKHCLDLSISLKF